MDLHELFESLYPAAYPSLAERTSLFAGLQFLLCAIVIVPPVILMGGSLPLLAHRMKNELDEIVHSVGAVYGWNMLGAAAGAALATYKLLPRLWFDGDARAGRRVESACRCGSALAVRSRSGEVACRFKLAEAPVEYEHVIAARDSRGIRAIGLCCDYI